MELRKLIGSRPIIMVGAGVIVHKGSRILFQLRTDNGLWGLPGGSMEPGEEMEQVAIRELFEETGLVANELKFFHLFSGNELYYQYPHGDEVYNVIAVYICTEFERELNVNNDEVSELKYFDYDNMPTEINPPDKLIIKKFLENLIVGSHTYTEILGVKSLAEKLKEEFTNMELVELVEEHFE